MPEKRMHPLARLLKMLRNVRQMRRDVDWWNEHRTDAPPFDVGPYIIMERAILKAVRAWQTEGYDDACRELLATVKRFASFE